MRTRISLTKQAGMSLTDLIKRISAALRQKFKKASTDEPLYYWPKEVFDDAVIVCSDTDGKTYRIPYTVEGDQVNFGEPVEVEEQYVTVQADGEDEDEAEREVMQSVLVRQSVDPEGWQWRIQAVQFGMSMNRHIWKPEIFRQSLAAWDGIGCYADHPTQTEMAELPERSIKNKVGWWSNFEITAQGMDATLTIKPSAEWLRQDLMAAHRAGKNDFYGFSILVITKARQVVAPDGATAVEHVEIVKPISIDCVTQAAANGHIRYALASARGLNKGAKPSMDKRVLAMLFRSDSARFALVRQSLAAAGTQGVTAETTEDQLAEAISGDEALVKQAVDLMETGAGGHAGGGGATGAAPPPSTGAQNPPAPIAFAQLPVELREGVIAQAFAASELPEAVQQRIRAQVGRDATLADVNAAIENAREVLAVVSQSGQVTNPRAEVTADRADKYSIALAKAFGLSREDYNGIESHYSAFVRQSGGQVAQPDQAMWNAIPALRSLREFYIETTGDRDLTGQYRYEQRITRQATWITSDFVELLANVMNKRLLRDYRAVDWGWRRIATIKSVRDFKNQEAILLGYLADLATVAQDASYVEATALTDTQELYSIAKRGRIVSLSLETVANDDLNGFVRVVGRMGRAAARTLAKFVWINLIINNPVLGADGVALFHATHNNLITDALSTTGLKNGVTRLLSQTEPGSGEPLVLSTMNLTLAVPPGLYLDSHTLTDFNNEPGGETSALTREIRRMGIMPVNVPLFTDATDWYLFADPGDVDMVEVGFYNGNEEPEFFTQMDPTQGDYFAKDVVAKYKVRHIYGGAPVDHRGMVKAAVVG